MLTAVDEALIVGTTSASMPTAATKLDQLAPYGTVPGQHADRNDGSVYFWTTRGVCSALPFTNLTEAQVSVSPACVLAGPSYGTADKTLCRITPAGRRGLQHLSVGDHHDHSLFDRAA